MQSPTPTPTPSPSDLPMPAPMPDAWDIRTVEDTLSSLHQQISAFLLFTAVVEVVIVFALGALVLGVLRPRG